MVKHEEKQVEICLEGPSTFSLYSHFASSSHSWLTALLTRRAPKFTTGHLIISYQSDTFHKDNSIHRGNNFDVALQEHHLWCPTSAARHTASQIFLHTPAVFQVNAMGDYFSDALTLHFQTFTSSMPSIFMWANYGSVFLTKPDRQKVIRWLSLSFMMSCWSRGWEKLRRLCKDIVLSYFRKRPWIFEIWCRWLIGECSVRG